MNLTDDEKKIMRVLNEIYVEAFEKNAPENLVGGYNDEEIAERLKINWPHEYQAFHQALQNLFEKELVKTVHAWKIHLTPAGYELSKTG